MTEREQYANFCGYKSTCEKVDVWVPQGSILGPFLFLIHFNVLQNNTSLKISNFADDALLYTINSYTYLKDIDNLYFELQKVSIVIKETNLN